MHVVLGSLVLMVSLGVAVPDRHAILGNAYRDYEPFWQRLSERGPEPGLGLRAVFNYALALCEARQHPERLERLFALAAAAQDRDPSSRGYGNLKWYWRDPGVTDTNAVEFCMQDGVEIWRRHGNWLPPATRRQLAEILRYAVEGCLRHRVPTSYTNIAIFNAGNLMALGELLGDAEAADEGYRRFDAVVRWTWEFGTHEYVSPTYYGTDLNGLEFIVAHAARPEARRAAAAMLELMWSDIAANWYPPAQKLAGSQSRSYDYLRGLGFLDQHLGMAGLLEYQQKRESDYFRPALAKWSPPQRLLAMAAQYPRLVRQRWGSEQNEVRTLAVYRDVSLGTSSATYGTTDIPLAIDLPGPREQARCYFIADGRQDPYGKNKFATGSAGHMKALHLTPFWTAAQQGPDALGLVVYRPDDLKSEGLTDLQSHLVIRRPTDGIWLGGKQLTVPPPSGDGHGRIVVPMGHPLVIRYGSAAVGVRILGAFDLDGKTAAARLIDDGNEHGVLRLSVDHGQVRRSETRTAAAALQVSVGSGLADRTSFDAWRARFDRSDIGAARVSSSGVDLKVAAKNGALALSAAMEDGRITKVRLSPPPFEGMLEVNGREIGRPLLEGLPAVRAHGESLRSLRPMELPSGDLFWQAENGVVLGSMVATNDSSASGGRSVSLPLNERMPKTDGAICWSVRVAHGGRYWLWGRVLAATPETDSFSLSVSDEAGNPIASGAWHTGTTTGWEWRAVALEKSKEPAALDLPAGVVRLQLAAREAGTQIDRLWLTADEAAQPQ